MGNCRKTGCCQDPDLTCYDKNPWWSECLSSCKEGIHDDEPKKIQGKWSCTCNATAKKNVGITCDCDTAKCKSGSSCQWCPSKKKACCDTEEKSPCPKCQPWMIVGSM